jgi:ferric-dicitrate binding protein FerR (iron transport regulator)
VNDTELEQLLKSHGRQHQPDGATTEKIRRATEDAWLAAVAEHQSRQQRPIPWRWLSTGIAAILLAAVMMNRSTEAPPQPVLAQVIFAQGTYQVNDRFVSAKQPIKQGDTLTSANDGMITLNLNGGATITLAANTKLQLTDTAALTLFGGKMYIDSPRPESRILINTAWGKIEDIGTQFEVIAEPSRLRVAMREGSVKLALDNGVHYAQFHDGVGDVVTIDQNLALTKTTVASNDAQWNWPLAALSSMSLEGHSVFELMQWVKRTTGKSVIYRSTWAEEKSKQTRLSGGTLKPEHISESLPLIFKTTTLVAEVKTDTIEIDLYPLK